jgi:hypothetical protein
MQRYIRFGESFSRFAENGEDRMTSLRRSFLVVGAAAFLSSQAAYAAPAHAIDPLVSLAALAGDPSNAAVCAGTTVAATAATAALQGAPGCVLPVTAPPPPVVQAGAPKTIGTLPILLGLAAIIAVAALLISGNGNGHGNPTPISPA